MVRGSNFSLRMVAITNPNISVGSSGTEMETLSFQESLKKSQIVDMVEKYLRGRKTPKIIFCRDPLPR